jgi:endonuclease-3
VSRPRAGRATDRPRAGPNVARESAAARATRARAIARALAKAYPDAGCALVHGDAWQLLIATILSAQCTDAMVNRVTPGLFAAYPTPAALAAAPSPQVEQLVQRTGFFHQKTRAIQGVARAVAARPAAAIPRTMDELVQLPGIGRKTANVVLGTAFGQPSIFVDTHVRRLSNRLGLTVHDDPEKIEPDLQALLPPRLWTETAHRLIHHGRQICGARKPHCSRCSLARWCPRIGVTVSA